MNDTSDEIERKFRDMLLAHSGEERLKMGCSMHATARALVIASIPEKDPVTVNRELFLRFYGDEFEPKTRKKILLALRKAGEDRSKPNTSESGAVHEEHGAYWGKKENRAKRSRR